MQSLHSATENIAQIFSLIDASQREKVLRRLSSEHRRAIEQAMEENGVHPKNVSPDVLRNLAEEIKSFLFSFNQEKEMLSPSLPNGEDSDNTVLLQKEVKEHDAPFSFLYTINDKDIAIPLCPEQPAVIALVLAYLPAKKIGAILRFFPENVRHCVVLKLADKKTFSPAVIHQVERIFQESIASSAREEKEEHRAGGITFLAAVLRNSDKQFSDNILGFLERTSLDLSEKVQKEMFNFHDIIMLSDDDLRKVLKEIPLNKLAIALKGADQNVTEFFLRNLSKRIIENLREEMELIGNIKQRYVLEEQNNILAIIRALESTGEISTRNG